MWPPHIPVNNHTLQHGYWFVKVNPCPLLLTHTLTVHKLPNKKHMSSHQSVYGIRSKVWLCLGVEEQHPPLHLPQHPPSWTPPTSSFQPGNLCPLTWMRVCLCLNVVHGSNGSGSSEDLFWKLDALQTFIRDLHWPEDDFAKHLESRIQLMSSNMIENCVKRCIWVENILRCTKYWGCLYYPVSYIFEICLLYCSLGPGWHLSPGWQRAANPQISAFLRHYAPCSMWWWMPRTNQLNCVQWKWAKR